MKCRKCRGEIPDGSRFCMLCGVAQNIRQNPKGRGNGQGSVYQLPNKKWIAVRTIGYEPAADGTMRRITRSKSGFRTKKEAVEYLPLVGREDKTRPTTFIELYDAWEPTHRAGKSTMDCYRAAKKYFRPIWHQKLADITVDDLQECLDSCGKGKRTQENMKALAGLIYKYAIPRNMAKINMGQYLIVGGEAGSGKDALPEAAVRSIEAHISSVVGADYVLCQCYLGFRPSEFLALDAINYNRKERAFYWWCKNRRRKGPYRHSISEDPAYCGPTYKRQALCPVSALPMVAKMSIASYRSLFYSVLDNCGIDNPILEVDGVKRRKYTPHSCRHTFATMMKRVAGSDKDKLELMGHTSPEMLRHYQDVSFEDLRKVTDAI